MFWTYNTTSPQIDIILCKEVYCMDFVIFANIKLIIVLGGQIITVAHNNFLVAQDLTLQELLDQENVLQELKAQNLKLIELYVCLSFI